MARKKRRPRILIVAEMFFPIEGGSERVAHNLALALHRRGFAPFVYTRSMHGGQEFDARQPYSVIRSRVWGRLWNLNNRSGMLSRLGRLITVPILFASFLCLRWDVMVAVHLVPVALPGRVLGWLGKPVCIWAHGEEIEVGLRSAMMRFQVKTSLGMARRIFCNSRETAQSVRDAGGSGERIVLQFPCPDRSFFAPLSKERPALRFAWMPDARRGELLFVTVTRLAERKGIDTVLRALAEICLYEKQGGTRPWRYLIGGVGADKPRLRRLVSELNLEDRVRFLGSITEEEKRDLIEAADLFLMPNRQLPSGEKEGFGIVFVEAALRGTPSLGGRSGGTADALADGTSGWLVDPASPDAARALLIDLLRNPAPLLEKREKIRAWAMETFKPHLRHDAVIAALRALIR